MPKLIVIDGNSLMYRAFYALPAMTSRGGTPTGAIYGFLSMLLKLAAGNPEYMLVAFDMHGPTIRHESYAEYKSNRKANARRTEGADADYKKDSNGYGYSRL